MAERAEFSEKNRRFLVCRPCFWRKGSTAQRLVGLPNSTRDHRRKMVNPRAQTLFGHALPRSSASHSIRKADRLPAGASGQGGHERCGVVTDEMNRAVTEKE